MPRTRRPLAHAAGRAQVAGLALTAVVVAMAAIGAAAALSRVAPAFEAVVDWRVAPAVAADANALADLAGVAWSDAVVRAALRAQGRAAVDEAVAELRSLAVVALEEGQAGTVVRLVVRDRTPWAATRAAAAWAAAFEADERERSGARSAAALAFLEARIDELGAQIRSLQVVGGAAAEERAAALIQDRSRDVAWRGDLAAAVESGAAPSAIARDRGPRARLAGAAARDVGVSALVGAVAGVLVSLALTLALGGARRRAPDGAAPATAAARPGGPIAVIPAATEDHDAHWLAGIDRLRQLLAVRTNGVRQRVFVVCRSPDMAGPATVASALAEEYAWHGARTLLVDGVLMAPSLADRYGVNGANGGAGLSDGTASTVDWLQRPHDPHLVVRIGLSDDRSLDMVPQFRPTRPAPGMADELFSGLDAVLERWSAYDVVVIDAPPLEVVDDALHLAARATGVLVEAHGAPHDRRAERRWSRLVRDTGAAWLGTVRIVTPDPSAAASPSEAAPPVHRVERTPTDVAAKRPRSR